MKHHLFLILAFLTSIPFFYFRSLYELLPSFNKIMIFFFVFYLQIVVFSIYSMHHASFLPPQLSVCLYFYCVLSWYLRRVFCDSYSSSVLLPVYLSIMSLPFSVTELRSLAMLLSNIKSYNHDIECISDLSGDNALFAGSSSPFWTFSPSYASVI